MFTTTRADVGLLLYRKIWQREVSALAEGSPLKNWRRSEAVIASEDKLERDVGAVRAPKT